MKRVISLGLALVAGLTSLIGVPTAASAAAGPTPVLRVMPLGDSITRGYGGASLASYRAPLLDLTGAQSRYAVKFVGSQADGAFANPAHEGHGGYTIDQIGAGVDQWIVAARPDVVLLHIGVNDLDTTAQDPAQAPDRLKTLVDRVFADKPGVTVIMQGVIPTTTGLKSSPQAYNDRARSLQTTEQQAGKKFRYVDAPALTAGEMYDRLHPDDSGYARMAQAFFAPLEQAVTDRLAVGGLDPSTAPAVRAISYNVCGGYVGSGDPVAKDGCRSNLGLDDWSRTLTASVTEWDPDAVMLQELCKGQLDALGARLPGYRTLWLETRAAHYGCGKWRWNGAPEADAPFGVGMLVRGSPTQTFSRLLPAIDPSHETRGLLCANAPVDGRATLVCAAHVDGDLKDEGAPAVVTAVRTWAQGAPVILGGDFNADPQDPNLSQYYIAQGGNGEFVEADQSDRSYFVPNCNGLTSCRSGAMTAGRRAAPPSNGLTTATRKFDYLFAGAASFDPAVADTVDVQMNGTSLSDHLMYRGAFSWKPDTQAPAAPVVTTAGAQLARTNDWLNAVDHTAGDFTGDGRSDLVLRDATGTVALYSGSGAGTFGAGVQLVSAAQGWWDAKSMTAGDFTGDGKADLLVRWAAGSVFLYPGNGTGGLGGSVPVVPAGGWTNAVDVTAGDFTGDGRADVVIRWTDGRVTLHPVTGASVFGTPVELRPAGDWTDATDVTAGDFNNDNKADLLVRWTAGSLFLYPGNGTGGLTGSVVVAAAPAWADARDLTAGEFTGDGKGDLLVRWADHHVQLVAGNGQSGFTPLNSAPALTPAGAGGFLDAADVIPGEFTGDGITDLVVRWNSGSVYLYPNSGTGTFSAAGQLAQNWSDAKSITAGDFTGDGKADLLVRWTAGSAFLYPGNGTGGLGGSVQVAPAGSWTNAVDVTAGDFTGDGRADAVIRWTDGRVTLHPATAVPGFGPLVELRPAGAGGWADAIDVTAGDFTGDGRADLLVRWTAGSVFLYPGDGAGGLGGSVPFQPAGAWSDVVDIIPGRFTSAAGTSVALRWSDGSVVLASNAGGPLTVRSSDDRGRVSHFLYSVDVPLTSTSGTRLDARHNAATASFAPPDPGSHTLYVAAVDLQGNQSGSSAYPFTVPTP